MVGNMGYGLWVFTNRTRRRRISLVSAASAARSEVGGKVVRSVDAEKHMKNLVWHRKTPIWSRIARKRCEDGEVRWKEKRHVHFTTCRLPFDHSGWSRHVLGRFLVWHISLSSAVFLGWSTHWQSWPTGIPSCGAPVWTKTRSVGEKKWLKKLWFMVDISN